LKTTLIHWLKFNLVGMLGVGVQLSSLALFNGWMRGHYLLATIAALELTLLHNFVWHLHFTWRDNTRTGRASALTQLFRFHLSNGLVSLAGNLALMRVLVSQAHLPLLASNAIAIVACSLVNFSLSHYWIFAAKRAANPAINPTPYPETSRHA
jgi:putative flippase GtrA